MRGASSSSTAALRAWQLLQRGMVTGKRQWPASAEPSAAAAGGGSRRLAAAPSKYKEPGLGTVTQLGGGAVVRYSTDLLGAAEAAALFEELRGGVEWEQRSVRVMGRVVVQPRLIAYMAEGPHHTYSYTYSGATLQPSPWHPAVAALRARVQAALGPDVPPFNSCLLNLYRSGQDSIAWHSDSEPLYGRNPTIASVSLGASREFLLRRNADHADKYRFRLGGGALLVMAGPVQEHWMHSVPRRQQAAERISLTFRRIVLPERGRAAGHGDPAELAEQPAVGTHG